MNFLELIPLLGNLLDRILPDPAAAADAKLKVLALAQNGELEQLHAETQLAQGQIDVNKIEAGSDNFFKSGWRPATGWACVSGLVYQVILSPIVGWIMVNTYHWSMPPSLQMDTLLTLLFGMLGLGAYRTYEKVKGTA